MGWCPLGWDAGCGMVVPNPMTGDMQSECFLQVPGLKIVTLVAFLKSLSIHPVLRT